MAPSRRCCAAVGAEPSSHAGIDGPYRLSVSEDAQSLGKSASGGGRNDWAA